MKCFFQVQHLVKAGLLFRWLGMRFHKTDTPFLASVVIGAITAGFATLGDVNWLLITGAAARIFFDLIVSIASLLVHYGVGLKSCRKSPGGGSGDDPASGKRDRDQLRRQRQSRRRQRRKRK